MPVYWAHVLLNIYDINKKKVVNEVLLTKIRTHFFTNIEIVAPVAILMDVVLDSQISNAP